MKHVWGCLGMSGDVWGCRPIRFLYQKSESWGTGARDVRFGSKVGQIGPKWDKSGTFSDQISMKSDVKIPGFVQFVANLTLFGGKPTIPASIAASRMGGN